MLRILVLYLLGALCVSLPSFAQSLKEAQKAKSSKQANTSLLDQINNINKSRQASQNVLKQQPSDKASQQNNGAAADAYKKTAIQNGQTNTSLKTSAFANSLMTLSSTEPVPQQRTCYTVELEKELQAKNPNRLTDQRFEEVLQKHITNKKRLKSLSTEDEVVLKIPVIVHIIHNGEPLGVGSNISQEQVMSQFDVLNEDYRRVGGGYNENPVGADIRIEFVPAIINPSGKILEEPGIDRQLGYNSAFDKGTIEFEVKPNTIWSPDEYLNIWTLNITGGIVAYAQFPSMSGLSGIPEGPEDFFTDGVVVGYRYFGRTGNVVAPYHLGKSLSHEVGHWLGLRHIWGDLSDCVGSDFCDDTPATSGPNYSCRYIDSCTDDDQPDMVENFMDYSTDACLNTFTQDQKTRMRTVMEVSPRRRSLVACQIAPIATEGINTASFAELPKVWYQYTAGSSAEVVRITSVGSAAIDTKLTLYKECNSLPVVTNDNAFGTTQSEASIKLEAGETVKILWEENEYGDFDWTLEIKTPEAGASCANAVVATEGDNVLPATTSGIYWYSYSPSQENQAISIQSGGKTFSVYENTCDHLMLVKSGNADQTIYGISKGKNIYIAFETEGGDFTWNITSGNTETSRSCIGALTAVQGVNTAAAAPVWYTFTMPHTGNITISTAMQAHARIYKGCDGYMVMESDPLSDHVDLTVQLRKGEVVKILWDDMFGNAGFDWTMNINSFAHGEICQVAVPAVQGINTVQGTPQWFKYTTTKRTNLKISSVGLTMANTHLAIKRSCNGTFTDQMDDQNGYDQAELVLYGLEKGETLFILWTEKWSYEGFDWKLEEVDPLPGDNCKSLATAKVGVNEFDMTTGHNYNGDLMWYKFTVPSNMNGKKLMATFDHEQGAILSPNCEYIEVLDIGYQRLQLLNVAAGEEFVFIWTTDYARSENKGYGKWTISFEDVKQGDKCDNPLIAAQGMNTASQAPAYYEYTMTQPGNLRISSVGFSDVNTELYVLSSCNGEVLYSSYDTESSATQGEVLIVGLNQGDKLLIEWNRAIDYRGFQWKLEELPLQQGDLCSNPLIAHAGLNNSPYATKWYKYTVEEAGKLRITSLAVTGTNTKLVVFDGCGGNQLGKSDDILDILFGDVMYYQSEVVLEDVTIGQELLIQWDGQWSNAPFFWKIIPGDTEQGDTCNDPLIAHEGMNNGARQMPAWFSFTMPRTASLILSSLNTTPYNTQVEVYDACEGTLLASNDDWNRSPSSFVYIPEIQEGQTIYIKWNTGYKENYTFDWQLIVGDPDPGSFSQFPVDAHLGTNTSPEVMSDYLWYTYTVPESDKKLTIDIPEEGYIIVLNDMMRDEYNADVFIAYAYTTKKLVVLGLTAGQNIYIAFGSKNFLTPIASFDWELKLIDFEDGDACDKAADAKPGLNETRMPTWQKFTATRSGPHEITSYFPDFSAPQTILSIYTGCDTDPIAVNDDIIEPELFSKASKIILDNLNEGETIYIKWDGEFGEYKGEMPWRISIPNHAPVINNTSFELEQAPQDGTAIGSLNAEDGDNDPLKYTITFGNDAGVFSVDENTGELTVDKSANISKTDYRIIVDVTDQYDVTSADIWVKVPQIVTSSDDDIEDVISAYPNPVNDYLNVQLPEALKDQVIHLVDVNGKVQRTFKASEKRVWVGDMKQGIYFIKFTTNQKLYNQKIAVIH